jgi:hypothetical protein
MTKGDNNPVDDRMLYPPGMDSIERRHIIGRAKGYQLDYQHQKNASSDRSDFFFKI